MIKYTLLFWLSIIGIGFVIIIFDVYIIPHTNERINISKNCQFEIINASCKQLIFYRNIYCKHQATKMYSPEFCILRVEQIYLSHC